MTGEEQAGTTVTLTGVEALVRLLVVRHELDEREGLVTATVVSGYPGSPLGAFDLTLEQLGPGLAEHRILHRPGVNEELAAAIVWGSQMGAVLPYRGVDGVVGAWYGKTPGLDRCGDVMKHANAMGAGPNGGVVMFCGDDPTAKSSTLPCDSQHAFEDACVPVLVPADPQDVIDLGIHAFRLSRYSGAWVGLKVVTGVADGVGTVDLGLSRHRPVEPNGIVIGGRPWRHLPLATIGPHQVPDQEILVVEHRLAAAKAYVSANGLDVAVGPSDGSALGIVCAGKTYRDVIEALRWLGVDGEAALAAAGIRLLKLAMTYPLVEETVCAFARSVDDLLVVEEKRPFIERQLRAILHEAGIGVRVQGKRDARGAPLVPGVGELDAAAVRAVLERVRPELRQRAPEPVLTGTDGPSVPGGRPPAFCSGCPHNRSTVVPAGSLLGGGVGCHGIVYFEPRHRRDTKLPPTPMGAEGVPWIGLAPFVDGPHLFQNLGDGTLTHSGILAIRACVAAGVDVTFQILYNRAVAMTGGQPVTGLLDVPALTRSLEAEGVRRIVVVTDDPGRYGRRAKWAPRVEVVHRDRLGEVQERLRSEPGVTVIVYDQQCAAEARRARKRGLAKEPAARVYINEAVCEGCGDCTAKSNCLSVVPVATEFGEKRQIDNLSCNHDYTCLEGECPSFVTIEPARLGRRRVRRDRNDARGPAPSPPVALPEPVPAVFDGTYSAYFTGIGGTGVVTANRLLAAAAEAAGFAVAGLDQTGLSQKGGAVVSHLRIARRRDELGAASVGPAQADLYVSSDLLQAAAPAHMAKVRPGSTRGVVDPTVVPTIGMLQDAVAPPDPAELRAALAARLGEERVSFVAARRIATAVFANPVLANVVLLGAAFQLGALPFGSAAFEVAMGRLGRAAEENRAAFAWGRWAVCDPVAVAVALDEAAQDPGSPSRIVDPSPRALEAAEILVGSRPLPTELRELLVRRTAQVIDYQDARLGRRFLALVEHAATRDGPDRCWALTRAVTESWFKLLTYKDEYEVARLHTRTDYGAVARRLGVDGRYTVRYHLHPPTLRRLGVKRKVPLGLPYELVFWLLCRMRRLRGTPLDPFGRDPDRRLERALIDEYEALVVGTSLPYEEMVRLAESVMAVRGFGTVKARAVAQWREEVGRLRGGARQ